MITHTRTLLLFFFRLYSDYLYFGTSNKSALDFHQKVCESLRLFDGCLRDAGLRACVYSGALYNAMSVSVPTSDLRETRFNRYLPMCVCVGAAAGGPVCAVYSGLVVSVQP